VSLYTSDVCLGHDPGGGHPEKPARLSFLLKALREDWVPAYGDLLRVCDPSSADATDEPLSRVHSKKHIERVSAAFTSLQVRCGLRYKLDSDTIVSPGTQAAAKRAAGLVVAAVDDVFDTGDGTKFMGLDSRARRAFVMARPPGHHAEADAAMGFCLYNNVLVGVAHAEAVHGASRVAIIDFDVHHGNGDADIAAATPKRLYVSSHETPSFPGTGETAGREGLFRNVMSAPLPAQSGSDEFRRAWRQMLLPAVRNFRPDAIFISAGFDAHMEDPLSSVQLDDSDFEWLTGEIVRIGGGCVPIVSVLEGGYNVKRLPESVRRHLDALIYS